METLATLKLKIDSSEAAPAAMGLDKLTAAGAKTETQIDKTAAATSGLAREQGRAASSLEMMSQAVLEQEAALRRNMAAAAGMSAAQVKLAADTKRASLTFTDFWGQHDFAAEWNKATQAAIGHAGAQGKVAAAGKLTANEMLNLSRQFSDIGVTAAMGMNPLMILIQQGPQMAESFATASARGLGFNAVLKEMAVAGWAAVAPFAPFIAGAAAIAAVVGGGLLVATHELNKEHKDFANTLGLTHDQLEKVKNKGITVGDVLSGTFKHASDSLKEYFAPALKSLSDTFEKVMDGVAKGMTWAITHGVAAFSAGIAVIGKVFTTLPQIAGDATISAANAMITGIQFAINSAIEAINKLVAGANEILGRAGLKFQIPGLDPVNIAKLNNPFAGAMRAIGEAGGKAFDKGLASSSKWLMDNGKYVLDAAGNRIKAEAGKGKAANDNSSANNGPANDYAQRIEALNAQLAQAKAAELQAQLSVVTDITARAALEHEILDAQTAAKMAGLDKQAAEIEAARVAGKITDTQSRELGIRLQELTFMETAIAMAKGREIDDKAAQALHKQSYAQQASGLQNQIDLLASQEQMLGTEYERQAVEEKILALQQQLERTKYEEVITSKASSEAAVNEAKARLATLEQIHANETYLKKHGGSLADAMQELTDALGGAASALMRGDWASALSSLSASMKALAKTMGMAGNKLLGSIGSTLSTAGSAMGVGQGLGLGTGNGLADTALSIGGAAAGSALAGSALAGTIGAGIANGVIGLGGSAALAGTLGTMLSSAAVLGPIAVIAALAVGTLFKSKPSNNGALATLSDTSATLSGDKRTSETSTMATNAANAILQGEAILRNAGITLSTTVRSIDIGTRDATDIILSDGRQLNTAVGDAAAAAEAGLRAVVEGATFASAAQESLVKNMLAAGKGFDDIAAALTGYSNAQAVNDNIALQIQQLADPQGYDITVLKASQKAQRDSLKALADAGYLAADQFQSASDQLTILEGLQLDEVLKKYNKAAADNSEITKTRADLEKQIFDLTHTSIEVRDAERQATLATLAAMDASLPTLQQRIYALNDEADALAAATKAREDEAKRLQQIADESRAKAEEAAKAAADLEARRRSLEINLMEVSGDAAGALAAKRADELAAMDASLRPLQEAINAQADLNEANAKAADINEKAAAAAAAAAEKAAALVAKRIDLENQLLTAMGRTGDVTARTRAASLAALDPSLRSIQEATDALTDANAAVADAEQKVADKRSALTTAYEAESAAIKATVDKFKTFTASLTAFRETLQIGDLANNAPAIQYARTKADFERVAGLAAQGNEQALGDLQGVSERYLKASGDYQQTNVAYFRDLSAVKNATEAAAGYTSSQVDVAQAQLNALDASVAGLLEVKNATLSVRDAISGLGAAISALVAANSRKSSAEQAAQEALNQKSAIASITIGANDNADLAAAKAIYLATQGGIDTATYDRVVGATSKAAAATMARVGYAGDPEALRKRFGFATGGSFTVGGPTTGDRVPVQFMANGGEHVNVSRSDNMARLADEIAALRAEVSALRNPMNRTADATERQTRILIAVTPNGDAIQTEAA